MKKILVLFSLKYILSSKLVKRIVLLVKRLI